MWVIILIIIGYIFMATIVGTLLSRWFYDHDIITDWADAGTFGWLCGIFWPISPILIICLAIHGILK